MDTKFVRTLNIEARRFMDQRVASGIIHAINWSNASDLDMFVNWAAGRAVMQEEGEEKRALDATRERVVTGDVAVGDNHDYAYRGIRVTNPSDKVPLDRDRLIEIARHRLYLSPEQWADDILSHPEERIAETLERWEVTMGQVPMAEMNERHARAKAGEWHAIKAEAKRAMIKAARHLVDWEDHTELYEEMIALEFLRGHHTHETWTAKLETELFEAAQAWRDI